MDAERHRCSDCDGRGWNKCTACSGTGFGRTCDRCNGTGKEPGTKPPLTCTKCFGNKRLPCEECKFSAWGAGKRNCSTCDGTGWVPAR